MSLEDGISDWKKPYYPDFGFPDQINFSEEKIGWPQIAKSIIKGSKHQ